MRNDNGIGKRIGLALMVAMACGALVVGRAEAASLGLPVGPGWNLVNSPWEPIDSKVDSVLAGLDQPYLTAWAWEAQTSQWQVRVASEVGDSIGVYATGKGFLPLSALHAGQGFWLNMTAAATLTINGNAPADLKGSVVKGWNLIGTKGEQAKTLAQVVSDLGAVGVKPLSVWAWQGSKWAVALPFAAGNPTADSGAGYAASNNFAALKAVAPGEGYWVNADAASADISPAVPTISTFGVSAVSGYPVIDFTVMDGSTPITGLTSSLLRFYVAELVPGAAATDSEQWLRWAYERTGTGTFKNPAGTSVPYTFGTFEDLGAGHYKYTFATQLSTAPQAANQQRLVMRISSFNGLPAVNKQYDFKVAAPATELTAGKDIVTSEACNTCHGANINNYGHGGGYTGTKTCVICHSPLYPDMDMAAIGVDFTTMIHQIHAAINAKTTPVANASAFDWSGITYPGVKSATAKMVVDCAKCHKGTAGDNWKTKPTMVACRSCHTAVVFDGVTSFTGLDGQVKIHYKTTSNAYCAMCHGGDDTFAPLAISHALPVAADVAKRTMSATIKTATVDATTGNVKITFTVDKAGVPVTDPTDFKSMAFTLAKLVPGTMGAGNHWQSYTARSRTKDAAQPPVIQGYSESAKVGTATSGNAPTFNTTTNVWEYTFALVNAEPEGDITKVTHVHNASAATLSPDDYTPAQHPTDPNLVTYSAALTHRVGLEFQEADGTANQTNATFDFVPNGAAVTETRAIVTMASCNSCHGGSRLHKGYAIEYCVTCHNQSTFDPYTGDAPLTVDLQTIIHKLHRGENLPSFKATPSVPYLINGGDFSAVKFPQSLKNCQVCHDEANADGANWKIPTRRACGTCHDSAWDVAHLAEHTEDATPAQPYSGDEVEDCAFCHAPGKSKAVAGVHAL